eukprot:scaffold236_cov419-Prasinococcus_capsulatus_cf.AAC.36
MGKVPGAVPCTFSGCDDRYVQVAFFICIHSFKTLTLRLCCLASRLLATEHKSHMLNLFHNLSCTSGHLFRHKRGVEAQSISVGSSLFCNAPGRGEYEPGDGVCRVETTCPYIIATTLRQAGDATCARSGSLLQVQRRPTDKHRTESLGGMASLPSVRTWAASCS